MKGGSRTLPACWYVDADVYARERTAVFQRHWLFAAHESEVPGPGSYVTVEVAGFRLVVARGADGVVRAFHNVCRHRAGPLVAGGAGSCPSFVCRYHGWTYDLQGALVSARDFGGDDEIAASAAAGDDLALIPVQVDSYRRLLFVALGEPSEPLCSWVDGLSDRLAGSDIENLRWAGRRRYELACNWKTYVDNFNEGYHLPLVHPGLARQVDAKRYRVVDHDDGRWNEHHAPPNRRALVTNGVWAGLFPNLGLNLIDEGLFLERSLPTGPETMELWVDFYASDHLDDTALQSIMDGNDEVTREDVAICEAVQHNLRSGIYGTGLLSPRHESALAGFRRRLLLVSQVGE